MNRLTRLFLAVAYLAALAQPAFAAPSTTMPVVTKNGQTTAADGVVVVDSTGADATDTTNHALKVNVVASAVTQPVSGSVSVSNFPVTQAISAASLPLPAGAATAAGLTAINTTLGTPMQQTGGSVSITGTLPAFAATPTVNVGTMPNVTLSGTSPVSVSNFPVTQAISAASLPLPTGAATAAGLTAINTTLGTPMQQTGGSVSITGTLPAFAATPTVNVGTMPNVTLSGTSPVSVSDGSDITLGAKADGAYAGGGGSASAISLLKGIYTATLAPLSAGTNNIGGVNLDNVPDGATVTNSVTSASTIVSLNMAGYAGCSIHVTSIGIGNTITFEGSNDNVNWVGVTGWPASNITGTPTGTATGTGIWTFSAPYAYIRARVSTYGSGTVTTSIVQKRSLQTNIPTSLIGGFSQNLGNIALSYSANGTNGGALYAVQSLAATTATQIKGAATRIMGWQLHNSAATVRSVKVFNALAASVTMGTTAATFEIDIPAGASIQFMAEAGYYFSAGITYAVTAAKGLTDNTATGLAANDVSGILVYGG
jgi:hypothetical protein